MNFTAKVHANAAAKQGMQTGQVEWVHICLQNAVPPIFDGSYNHLLWQILEKRKPTDMVIGEYFPESFDAAKDSLVPVVQIKTRKPSGIYALEPWRRRILKPFRGYQVAFELGMFLKAAVKVIKSLDNPKIMIWGVMNILPELRQRLPNHTIAFAQRHYDYPVEKSHYNLCDLIVMQTKGQVRHAFDRMSDVRPYTIVVPNGVELDKFNPSTRAEREDRREQRKIPKDKFVVLFPSKLAPYKGTSYLIRWIERCRTELPNVHFVVVGRPHSSISERELEQLKRVLGSSANCSWIEGVHRSEMKSLYGLADACLMPALWREGFSMSAIEAMASGLPLIASDSGCYSEIVKDGYNGILCAVEDLFEAGFQALKKLSTDRELADSMGRNARSYSVSKLSREKVLSNFIAVLEDRSDSVDNDLSFLLEQPTAV